VFEDILTNDNYVYESGSEREAEVSDEEIELEVQVVRQLFYDNDRNFGIYGCLPSDTTKVKLNAYGNISLKGVMPPLQERSYYKVFVKEVRDPKWGIGYELIRMNTELPTSVDTQRAYLSTILTELQVQAIYEVYDGQDVLQMFRDDTLEYNRIRGFGETTYKRVREKVLASIEMAEALAELSQYGLNYNMVSKLIGHYGSAGILMQKVKENPYILTQVDGIGFKKCDQYALKMGVAPDSSFRIDACIKYILEESTNDGHTWMYIDKLLNRANELLGIGIEKIDAWLGEYGRTEQQNQKYILDKGRIGLYYLFRSEFRIKEKLFDLLSRKHPIQSDDIDKLIEKVEEEQGFKFTDEQRTAIVYACNYKVLIIHGKAGTGKTTILKGIIRVLNLASDRPLLYKACALSGKAAQRINESTGLEASTIHRMLGYEPRTGGFFYCAENPLQEDVVIGDEFSMINVPIGNSLIQALPDNAIFIMLGDTEQLEPIGAGNLFKDLIDSQKFPTVTLTQVHRQAQMSGILSTANLVREGVQFAVRNDYGNRVIGELKDLHFRPYETAEDVFKTVMKYSISFYQNFIVKNKVSIMDFQVITPLKERGKNCTRELNLELQKVFNDMSKPYITRNKYDFREGDKVIQNGNNYDDMVFNGTLGTITKVHVDPDKKESYVLIEFVGTGTVKYTAEQMSQIELAYALTVHRVQGSQFEIVLFAMDYSAFKLLSRQLVYTALTRAVKTCVLIVELNALIYAVDQNKSAKRNTFLPELLENFVLHKQ